ncbi:MAG: response regulator [Candidatus Pacebacteria bacterium]|nr:response regulator [Candidatus Paceibacterota bacterium]
MEKEMNVNILIIEENKIFREMLVEKLNKVGYNTSFLESNATIDDLRDADPQIMFINITTPKEKGLKLIEEMRADKDLSRVPIIAIAKAEGSVLVEYARKLGVKYFVDRVIFDAENMLANVSSLLNEGSLPVDTSSSESKKDLEEIIEKGGEEGHVLLIEDDIFMRELFAKNLRGAGFSVDDAEDAVVGEKKLATTTPHVVLLDLLLPGKSGFQFLAEMKRRDEYKDIPVIVVSNLGSKGDIDRALDLGASDFLIKANSTIDEIISKTKKFIEKGRKEPIIPKSLK